MNMAKKMFVQSMAISTGILLLNGINMVLQHFDGQDVVLLWYHPLSIVLTGILCALPTILLRNMEEWPAKVFWRRVALHGLSLYAIVIGMGWLFGWYQELDGFIGVSIVFLLVYGFVWLSSRWMDKQDAKKINQALEAIRDSE